jgi:hypothetical protein
MASPCFPRRRTEAPGIKRLGYLQQKLPLSLHRKGILEAPKIFVCSVLHTPMQIARIHLSCENRNSKGTAVVFLEQNLKSQTISRDSRHFFNTHVMRGQRKPRAASQALPLLRTGTINKQLPLQSKAGTALFSLRRRCR